MSFRHPNLFAPHTYRTNPKTDGAYHTVLARIQDLHIFHVHTLLYSTRTVLVPYDLHSFIGGYPKLAQRQRSGRDIR